jgi:hypothetical protein
MKNFLAIFACVFFLQGCAAQTEFRENGKRDFVYIHESIPSIVLYNMLMTQYENRFHQVAAGLLDLKTSADCPKQTLRRNRVVTA